MLNKKMIQLLLIGVCVGLSSAQDLDRSTWFPFSLPWNDTSVTVTSMLEAANVPAGKNGFLTVGADGHFHYAGKTDVVRFSGVVITAGANMPAKADAPAIAGRMAKYGINLVRVHLIDIPGDLGLLDYDANNTPVFNAVRLDRFDFFMKCLKDKGIHILMPLWGGREFNPGNGVPAGGGHHTPVLYDPVLIGLEKAYAKALFTHVNPYTGAAYKDDPFVALTEMVNETSLFRGWIGATDNTIFSNAEGGQLNPFYAHELDSLFNEFLKVKYGNDAALAAAWSQGGQGLQGGEVMSAGTVKRTKRGDINSFSDARIADNAEFYYSVESKFITSMKSFLRDSLGVKTPITFTNQYFGLTSLASQSQADFMDTHRYWDYPNGNAKPGAFTIQNVSMLKSPTWSVIPYITLSHVEGKPLVVSEYNHPFPNAYQEEAPAFLYGYLGLMGADAVIWHCYKDFTPNYDSAAAVPFYEMRANPTILTQMLLSRAYLKGYLQSPAPTTVQYTDADLFKSAKRGEDKTQFNTPTISPAAAGLANPIVQKFHATSTAPAQLSDPGQYIQSSTKEVIWDGGKGLLSFNSPKWQGATGFLQDGIKLSSFTIGKVTTSNGRNFAAVHLMSLDGLPLSTSNRRILIAAARFENKGMVWNAGQTTVTNFGMDSAICEPVRAQVGIKMVHAESLVVYALDVFGSRTTPVAVEIKADTAYFNLAANTLWYEVSSKNAPPFAGIRRDGNGLARDAGELIFSTRKNGFQVHVPEGLNHSQYRIQLQLTDIRGKIVYEKPWTQLGGARDGMLTVQLGDRAGVRGAARELLVLSAKIADSEGRVVKAKSGRVVGL